MSLPLATRKVGEVGILVQVRRLREEGAPAVRSGDERCPVLKTVCDPDDLSPPSPIPSPLRPSLHTPTLSRNAVARCLHLN